METPEFNIEIVQGATFDLGFMYEDETGTPIDLSSSKIRMQFRQRHGGKVLANLSSDTTGITRMVDNLGGFDVRIDRAATLRMPPTEGVYDVFIDHTGGVSECLIRGELTIIPAVTK